ncbi:zinc-ribbon domain-containing protein [Virgibacillus halophilus]|uniref:zinc-ribbon domain-containing protein n=1 Tax=Tigheibacillus halophilus TaxID=361280 RepID=UPI00363FBD44
MKCYQCGHKMSDSARFCEKCGADIYQAHVTNDSKQHEVHKVVAMLAYVGILFFLPLVVNPKSETGAFHANQGLVLLIFSLAGQVVFKFMEIFLWFLWPLTTLLQGMYGLVMLLLMMIGMMHAYRGEKKQLPIIGGIRML